MGEAPSHDPVKEKIQDLSEAQDRAEQELHDETNTLLNDLSDDLFWNTLDESGDTALQSAIENALDGLRDVTLDISREALFKLMTDPEPDGAGFTEVEANYWLQELGFKEGDNPDEDPKGGDELSEYVESLGLTPDEIKQLVDSYDLVNSQIVTRRLLNDDGEMIHGPAYANDMMWINKDNNSILLRKLPTEQLNMTPRELIPFLRELIPNPIVSNMPFEVVDTEDSHPNFVIEDSYHGLTVAELLEGEDESLGLEEGGNIPALPTNPEELFNWILNPDVPIDHFIREGVLDKIPFSGVESGLTAEHERVLPQKQFLIRSLIENWRAQPGANASNMENFVDQVTQQTVNEWYNQLLSDHPELESLLPDGQVFEMTPDKMGVVIQTMIDHDLISSETAPEPTEAPTLDKATLELLLHSGTPDQITKALLEQPIDLGEGPIQLAPFKEIDGFEAMIDTLIQTKNPDQAISEWYDSLLISHSDIVGVLGEDLFEPRLETLPQILTALVELGHVDQASVVPQPQAEESSETHPIGRYTERLSEYERQLGEAVTLADLQGKPVEDIKEILKTQKVKINENMMLDLTALEGTPGYDQAVQAFAEFFNDRAGNKAQFETFLNTWYNQLKATTPDGKIGNLPEDFTPKFENFAVFLHALQSLSTVENSPILTRPEALKANPGAIDYGAVEGFTFDARQIEGARQHPAGHKALATLAASGLSEALGEEYATWLDEQIQTAQEQARQQGEGDSEDQSLTERDILGQLTNMFQSGEVEFPEEMRLLLGDDLVKTLQDPAEIAKGKEHMVQLAKKEMLNEAFRYFNGELDTTQLENLMYKNSPLALNQEFMDDYRHFSMQQLKDARDSLGYPGDPSKREEYGNFNKLMLYRHLLDNGVPSWATNFGDPSYAQQFANYLQQEKNLSGNPYDTNFNPTNINATEVWNEWFENVMVKEEKGFTAFQRLIHQLMTFLKDLGLVERGSDEKDAETRKTEFLQHNRIGEDEEQRESREEQEAIDQKVNALAGNETYWTKFELKDETPEQDFNSADADADNIGTRAKFLHQYFTSVDELTNFEDRFLKQSDIQEFTSGTLTMTGIQDMLEGTEKIEVEGDKMILTVDEEAEISAEIAKADLAGAEDADGFIAQKLEDAQEEADAMDQEKENERLETELSAFGDRLDGVTISLLRDKGLIEEAGEEEEDEDSKDELHPLFVSLMSGGDQDFWTTSAMMPFNKKPIKLNANQISSFGDKVEAGTITGLSYEAETLKVQLSSGERSFDSMEDFAEWL